MTDNVKNLLIEHLQSSRYYYFKLDETNDVGERDI